MRRAHGTRARARTLAPAPAPKHRHDAHYTQYRPYPPLVLAHRPTKKNQPPKSHYESQSFAPGPWPWRRWAWAAPPTSASDHQQQGSAQRQHPDGELRTRAVAGASRFLAGIATDPERGEGQVLRLGGGQETRAPGPRAEGTPERTRGVPRGARDGATGSGARLARDVQEPAVSRCAMAGAAGWVHMRQRGPQWTQR